jgi:hypothetical protein
MELLPLSQLGNKLLLLFDPEDEHIRILRNVALCQSKQRNIPQDLTQHLIAI